MSEVGARCPTCGASFATVPKRKRVCPSCRNPVLVKTDPNTGERSLMTTSQATQVEAENRARFEKFDSFHWLEKFGLPTDEYESARGEILVSVGFQISERQVLREFLKRKFESEKDAYEKQTFALCLAESLDSENLDFRPYLGFTIRRWLVQLHDHGFRRGVIVAAPGACQSCLRLDGTSFRIESKLDLAYFPGLDCTATLRGNVPGWCRCTVEPAD